MRKLLFLIASLVCISSAYALPQCEGVDETKWQNCEGILTSFNAREYVGVFNDGIFDGENENKVRYVGEYKNGTMQGKGTLTFADGDQYVGSIQRRSKD